MSGRPLRVALFTDCFDEMNGVALTCRQFLAYAERRNYPFLLVKTGRENSELWRGPQGLCIFQRTRFSFPVDTDLSFDLLFLRRLSRVRRVLRTYQPDVVHITGPGDIGILGAIAAHEIGAPLAVSWHTNLHEFAERRLEAALEWLPGRWRHPLVRHTGGKVLEYVLKFYSIGKLLFAPNGELVQQLHSRTGKPVHLMNRGVDVSLFHPGRRTRPAHDAEVLIGYAGRIVPEKGVRLLSEVEKRLQAAGVRNYRFLIVGQGGDRGWLESRLQRAEFTGVLHGEALAEAYANMDIFAFPSRTDTFGNVVQEALACGVPAVVTSEGGPKHIVSDGVNGFVTKNEAEFCETVVRLSSDRDWLARTREAVRENARFQSWDSVFDRVYLAYQDTLKQAPHPPQTLRGTQRRLSQAWLPAIRS
jgi:phosphatidylinositol alpha 1,6-mannosyltransferase